MERTSENSNGGILQFTEPDLLLPSQLPEFRDEECDPERALMRAILKDGIAAFTGRRYYSGGSSRLAPRRRLRKMRAEAEEWIFSDDEEWPFSFLNICSVLGMNPEYLREGLIRSRQEKCSPPHNNP